MKAKLYMCVLMAFPFLADAHCDSIEITETSWESSGSALAMTFTSKPGKIYEVQGSPDLAGFSPLADVAGPSELVQTTVAAPSAGEDQYFFRIQEKLDAPNATWLGSHGGTGEESHGHYIMECQDGGFLQVGETGFLPNTARILVVKTNSLGQLIWKKEFGTGGHNLGNSSLEASDGYLIAGAINRNSAILKLDKLTGAILFQETFDNGGVDAFEHLAHTPTGILAVGYRNAEDPDNTFFTWAQGHITFLDNGGGFIRSQSINEYMSQGYRIKQAGLDYIIAGQSEDALEYRLIKITATGAVLWNETYGGNSEDHCFGLDLGQDGSIFLTGHTLSGVVNWDTYTIKLDSDGVILWEQVVGNPRGFDPQWVHDETWGIKATCDGGCIISAGTGDEYPYTAQIGGVSSDQWEAYIVKYDANGNMEWQATYNSNDFGLEGSWAAEDIDLTSDGGAIIAVDNGQFGCLKLAPF
jgi:hypothetical protein